MITLVFLLCFDNGQCMSATNQSTFKEQEQCVAAGEALVAVNKARIAQGLIEKHTAEFKCIEWGKPV